MGLGLGAKTLVAVTGATALPLWALSWHSAEATTGLLELNSPLVTNGREEVVAGGFGVERQDRVHLCGALSALMQLWEFSGCVNSMGL